MGRVRGMTREEVMESEIHARSHTQVTQDHCK